MGFGNESTLKVRRPSFRQKVLQDMYAVVEGRGVQNASLLSNFRITSTDVPMITENGSLIIAVGYTSVGSNDVVGARRKLEVS